jgi:hypothetical protein
MDNQEDHTSKSGESKEAPKFHLLPDVVGDSAVRNLNMQIPSFKYSVLSTPTTLKNISVVGEEYFERAEGGEAVSGRYPTIPFWFRTAEGYCQGGILIPMESISNKEAFESEAIRINLELYRSYASAARRDSIIDQARDHIVQAISPLEQRLISQRTSPRPLGKYVSEPPRRASEGDLSLMALHECLLYSNDIAQAARVSLIRKGSS